MKQLLVELDDEMAEQLERVAPAQSRRRSEFIRAAIRQALWEQEERAVAEAYGQKPDTEEAAYFDPQLWSSPEGASGKP